MIPRKSSKEVAKSSRHRGERGLVPRGARGVSFPEGGGQEVTKGVDDGSHPLSEQICVGLTPLMTATLRRFRI
jgi:hypothetical protein